MWINGECHGIGGILSPQGAAHGSDSIVSQPWEHCVMVYEVCITLHAN